MTIHSPASIIRAIVALVINLHQMITPEPWHGLQTIVQQLVYFIWYTKYVTGTRVPKRLASVTS